MQDCLVIIAKSSNVAKAPIIGSNWQMVCHQRVSAAWPWWASHPDVIRIRIYHSVIRQQCFSAGRLVRTGRESCQRPDRPSRTPDPSGRRADRPKPDKAGFCRRESEVYSRDCCRTGCRDDDPSDLIDNQQVDFPGMVSIRSEGRTGSHRPAPNAEPRSKVFPE